MVAVRLVKFGVFLVPFFVYECLDDGLFIRVSNTCIFLFQAPPFLGKVVGSFIPGDPAMCRDPLKYNVCYTRAQI